MSEALINDDNISISVDTLTQIYDYACKNKIVTLTELKNIYPPSIIDACCKIVSINIGKKRFQKEQAKNKALNKQLKIEHTCYICRKSFVNRIKTQFCDDCKNININKRTIMAHLDDKIAVVTGGRVKIGFEIAIRLLECNCTVVVTSRFVGDTIERFKKHPHYETFKNKLIIYPLPLDLRRKTSIDDFCQFMYDNFPKLDILINNAAQTIRRPKEFYEHLIPIEQQYIKLLTDTCNNTNTSQQHILNNSSSSATIETSITPYKQSSTLTLKDNYTSHLMQVFQPLKTEGKEFFPLDNYDLNGEQVDLRKTNTWIKELGDVEVEECVECMTINALAPFHLNQMLKQLLKQANGAYIVNVSSMEGVFNMKFKTANHPHTNMAKASLNMMTRTSAKSYAREKIYMVGVDTGWITNEFPNEYSSKSIDHKDAVPLDNIDGACRVLDPVFGYYNTGKSVHGVFLKDYVESAW
jgi:NAD(P)-dependent dehydrogenase (short-subunit alcohol dehydrogenase family)